LPGDLANVIEACLDDDPEARPAVRDVGAVCAAVAA
jgi:hypothetical protein